MIDALFDFVVMIKDFVMSFIDGMTTLSDSLLAIVSMFFDLGRWMPAYLVGIILVTGPLLIMLRVIGR